MQKMKIGYLMQEDAADIRNKPFSGPSTHVRQVFQQLRELGHTTRLIARFDAHIWKSDDLINFDPVTVPWLDRGPLRWFERAVRRIQFDLALPYLTFFESLRFAAACCQELDGFDLLYERMSWMGYGGGLASSRMDIPLILENNGDHLTEMEILGLAPRGLQRWVSVQLMAWGVKQAVHVVAAGDGWRTKCIDRWGLPPERVTTIDNGCELVNLLNGQVHFFD